MEGNPLPLGKDFAATQKYNCYADGNILMAMSVEEV